MLLSLAVGLVAGFILAIPPGPIAVAVIKNAFSGNTRDGVKIAASASAMDIIYALVAAFASSALVSTLKDKLSGNALLLLGFQVVAIVVLVVLGVRYLKSSPDSIKSSEEKEEMQEKRAERMGYTSPWFVGLAIAITNLASPTFLPSFIFVIGLLQGHGWVGARAMDSIFYAVGFGAGAMVWFFALLRTLSSLRDKLSPNFTTIIYNIAAGSMLIFACVLTYNVIASTPWSTLFSH
jgi:threonine/homoserine/homoserine lactone efflux protein